MQENNQIVNTLLYIGDEGEVSINVVIDQERETMWATQKTMAELFNVNVPAISKHLKNIFEEGELKKKFSYFQNGNNCIRWKKIQYKFL